MLMESGQTGYPILSMGELGVLDARVQTKPGAMGLRFKFILPNAVAEPPLGS
jgi:hypothetical protein